MTNSSWLDEHLETFVRPVLGYVPEVPTDFDQTDETFIDDPASGLSFDPYVYVRKFSRERIALLNTVWQEAKMKAEALRKSKILLPGRDTYLFEIFAKMEGFDAAIFKPEISSNVSQHQRSYKGLYPEAAEWSASCYGIDSGYRGSVLTQLGVNTFGLVAFGQSTTDVEKGRETKQILPTLDHQTAVFMCGDMECSPKYWTRAGVKQKLEGTKVVGGEILQDLNKLHEFKAAAILTRHVAEVFDPTLKVEVPTQFDLTYAGRPAKAPKGVDLIEGKYGWFFHDAQFFHCYRCSGLRSNNPWNTQGFKLDIPGCNKHLKLGKWFLGGIYPEMYPTQFGQCNGAVLCHLCCEKAGIKRPVPQIAMGTVTLT